jgi:type 2 lantibiotic biosynthesis protein LanM
MAGAANAMQTAPASSNRPDGGMRDEPTTTEAWRAGLTAAERRRASKAHPAWARRFKVAYATRRSPLPSPGGLLGALTPLADAPRRKVRAALAASSVTPTQQQARERLIEDLERALFSRLFSAASRTLVLELGAASARGLLVGDSPEVRFDFFCDSLADRAFTARLLAQYPALARRLVAIIGYWQAATLETLARLTADRDRLRVQLFGGDDPGAWTGAEPLGDHHRGGRAVQRLSFASGAQLIYKPRPVAMEGGFHALVAWLNAAGLSPPLRAVEVIERGAYGWARWVEVGPCADAAGVGRFFQRQGGNLALAYLLGAVDLHFENVIAAGEHPVIVDLETLFETTPANAALGRASAAAFETLNDSVIRTLLLPIRIEGDPDGEGGRRSADISALGYAGDEQSIYFARGWDQAGSDAMRMTDVRATMPAARCLPLLDGRRIPADGHVEDIVAGFADAYDLVTTHRAALADLEAGPLRRFRGAAARRVLRPTSSYVRLLDASWHPALAGDMQILETRLSERLGALDPSSALTPPVLAAETADLIDGDIPYFVSPVGSSVRRWGGTGRRILPPAGGWEACQRRLARLSPADRDRQLWMTRLSFVTFDKPLVRPVTPTATPAGSQAIEVAARAIGDQLCALAVERDGRASWLFAALDDRRRLSPAVVGFDLYDGLAGIAVFLAALWVRTGAARYRRLAEAALAEAVDVHQAMPRERVSIGAFDGAGGFAWALALAGRWFAAPALGEQALGVMRRHLPFAADEPALDLLSGRAGFLAAGLAVAAMTGDAALAEALGPCARSLHDLDAGALPGPEEAGLAHGRAGVGLALARWARHDGDDLDFEAACGLLAADLASAEAVRRGEQPALSEHDGRAMAAWCRGGLGVALAGIRLDRPQPEAARALVEAVGGLQARGEGAALCLCHGSLGMLEFLDAAAGIGVPGAQALAGEIADETLARVLGGETCTDHYHRTEAPGLMRGLAGTGYALLRLLDPAGFVSVLTLEAG